MVERKSDSETDDVSGGEGITDSDAELDSEVI